MVKEKILHIVEENTWQLYIVEKRDFLVNSARGNFYEKKIFLDKTDGVAHDQFGFKGNFLYAAFSVNQLFQNIGGRGGHFA